MNTVKILDRSIAFQRIFVDVTGSVTGALLLSQAVYWQNRCKDEDGWWFKTIAGWKEETGMTRHELDGAKKSCAKYIKTQLRGVPAKTFYTVDIEALELGLELAAPSLPKSGKLDCQNPANKAAGKRQATIKNNITSDMVMVLSPKRAFTDRWCSEFKAACGTPYLFNGAADGKAADKVLSSGLTIDEFFTVARVAWKQTDEKSYWWCVSQSRGLASFVAGWNKIKGEVDLMKRKSGQLTTILPANQFKSAPGGNNGRF